MCVPATRCQVLRVVRKFMPQCLHLISLTAVGFASSVLMLKSQVYKGSEPLCFHNCSFEYKIALFILVDATCRLRIVLRLIQPLTLLLLFAFTWYGFAYPGAVLFDMSLLYLFNLGGFVS